MTNLNGIMKQLEQERDRIESAIRALRGVSSKNGAGRTKRTLSTAARRRIAQHRENVGRKLEQERSEADYRPSVKLRHSVPETTEISQSVDFSIHVSGASTA
jgi:SMC interacting uncharacterized protein involved in chromosome segregation